MNIARQVRLRLKFMLLPWLLGAGAVMNAGALMTNLLFDQGFTAGRVTRLAVSSITLVTLLVFWKPFTAFTKAVQHLVMEYEAIKPMAAEARQMLNHAEKRLAEAEAAENPEVAAAAAQEVRALIERLHVLAPEIEPRLLTARDNVRLTKALWEKMPHRRAATWVRQSFQRQLVAGLTILALAVAGQRGDRMRDTWMADLVGAPEDGLTLSGWGRVRHSAGFVVAAIRMRSRTISAPLWRPVEWLLTSESRTSALTALVVGTQVIYIQFQDGLHGLFTDGWGWCGSCAAALHFLFRWLRKVRGIELAASARDADDR